MFFDRSQPRLATTRAGVTMTEMLIALAVVAVIAALLFPTFSRAIASSKMAECTANLRSIGSAAHLYAAEHNGLLPGAKQTPAQEGQPTNYHSGEQWDVQIMPYLGLGTEVPTHEGKTPFYCPASSLYPGRPLSRQLSYAWNSRINEAFDSKRLSQLDHPATILLAVDNKWQGDQPDQNQLTFHSSGNTIYINNNLNQLRRVAYERHDGRANVLFADGHVAAREPVSKTNPTPRRVRFYNNGPLSPGD